MGNYYVTDKFYGNTAPKEVSEPVFGIRTIGASKWIDQSSPDPIKAIQGEIWAGAGHIEITAPGTGRGGRGNSTYEEFDDEQRQAIRELVKINKVNLSIHATPNVQMTGMGQEGFSDNQRQKSIEEVKKAIDFARDVSSGGSVVVHTGEFPRALDVPGRYEGQFRFYDTEKKDAQYYLVDDESGRIIKSVRANEEIAQPVYRKDSKTKEELYLKDENGNPVYDDVLKKYAILNAKLDPNDQKSWDKVPAKDKERALIRLAETDEHGNIQMQPLKFEEFKNEQLKQGKDMNAIVRAFYEKQAYGSVQQALGQSRLYEDRYARGIETREKSLKELGFYKHMHEKLGDGEEWNRVKAEFTAKAGGNNSRELLDPLKELQRLIDAEQREIQYGQETAIGGRRQAQELLKQIDKVRDIESYALEKSRKSFAELGIYAMQQTAAAKQMRPGDDVKPIFVSLENIYPEFGYGSHPEELIKLVKNAREEMTKQLVEQKRVNSESEAKKLADQHIKVTFDTGHMNMWRKHFIPKDGDSKEKTDEKFNDWYLKQVRKLAEGGYIGNVHLADNFGYDDTHLAPGHGNAPIKDVLDILKKNGYSEKMAVEGGFNQGKNGYHETWKMVGAHIDNKYSRGRAGTDAWLNPNSNFGYVRDAYLGRANRPNFIFRGYSPDSDDWKPWSGSGME